MRSLASDYCLQSRKGYPTGARSKILAPPLLRKKRIDKAKELGIMLSVMKNKTIKFSELVQGVRKPTLPSSRPFKDKRKRNDRKAWKKEVLS